MKLSIIIPTYNRSNLLAKSLQALCGQSSGDRIQEVLVVSDGATDETPEVVASFATLLPIRCISQPKSGVSAARNLGLQEARGGLVLLLDDDVVPSPDLVLQHTDFHQHHSELETVLLGYVTWLPELQITPFMRWYGEHALFLYALIHDKDGHQIDRRFLYTCNVSFKTQFLRANGGMNQNLSVYEDHELGYRLAKQGMKLYFRRDALGYHNQTFTFQQACDRMARYSTHFDAFFRTEAGREFARSEYELQRPLKELAKNDFFRLIFRPLIPLLNSGHRFPDVVYQTFYGEYSKQPDYRAIVKAQPKRTADAQSR